MGPSRADLGPDGGLVASAFLDGVGDERGFGGHERVLSLVCEAATTGPRIADRSGARGLGRGRAPRGRGITRPARSASDGRTGRPARRASALALKRRGALQARTDRGHRWQPFQANCTTRNSTAHSHSAGKAASSPAFTGEMASPIPTRHMSTKPRLLGVQVTP